MDSFLITLIVIVIAGLSNWLQQRAQGRGPSGESTPDAPFPRRPTRQRVPSPSSRPAPTSETSLERELRRLLGEDSAPPDAAEQHPPRMAPPPAPPVLAKTVTPPTSPGQLEIPPIVLHAPAKPLSASQQGYAHAQQLHENVAERLRQVDDRTEKHGRPLRVHVAPAPPTPTSPVFAVRHSRAAARQAFVASLVFGQPKAFEP